ncbi:MAG: hypothetical protein ACYTF6_00950 [Planctomycetota bacterium]|jgi:hypothetical protein
MKINVSTPWHKASYDRFLNERLPELLSRRLPLAGYAVEPDSEGLCRVRVAISGEKGEVEVTFTGVPLPDDEGLFHIDGKDRVVVPTASCEELDKAEIRCVGEQLYDLFEQRLGEAPAGLAWDEALIRSWLLLDCWIVEFLGGRDARSGNALGTAQRLDSRNWLSRQTHLRRVAIPERGEVFARGQLGRVCPIETPEGQNVGRILHVAVGAEIRDGKLVVVDERPEAALGISASMIPLLEHDDCNRALMGANMQRQWVVPDEPEPALVQTGNEPAEPRFWCGRNLLTAYVSWGPGTFEDGILVSESAARKLDFPHSLEPGDKLSNRHGTKGTVGQILPDGEMPYLPDGTPVELIFNFLGCISRLNFGQIREAVMGRIARAEGQPVIVPPFAAPSDEELRERLKAAGLPESGMETLTMGKGGKRLKRPSTVGWVYWGKTYHLASDKIRASVTPTGPCNMQGTFEYYVLRDAGAFENVAETFNTRSVASEGAETLAERVAAGPVARADAPTPKFKELTRRLAAAGIRADFDGKRLAFSFIEPGQLALALARPVPHPWLSGRTLEAVGELPELPEYAAVVTANDRMKRLGSGKAPGSLAERAADQLAAAVGGFFEGLLRQPPLFPTDVRTFGGPLDFHQRVMFSGRAVISPALDLRLDQLGVADEIAWTMFGPLVARQVGSGEVEARTKKAAAALDKIMADSWVLLNRAPSVLPTSILAFHPVRITEKVLRLHPLACRLLNADFDGDQAAVFLPVTEAAQKEAGEKLTIAAHVRRDAGGLDWVFPSHWGGVSASLLDWVIPAQDPIWGLAELSPTPAGLKEICDLATIDVEAPEGFVTRWTVEEAMSRLRARDGVEKTLAVIERLLWRGFEVAKESGASLSPFVKADVVLPSPPVGEGDPAWVAYEEELAERISSRTDFDAADLGPQLLALKTGARGNVWQLRTLLGGQRIVNVDSAIVGVPRSLADGLKPHEYFTRCVGARRGLAQTALHCAEAGKELDRHSKSRGFNVLARAARAQRPGVVFAHAAAIGEVDPLTDLDARLFVGLSPVLE